MKWRTEITLPQAAHPIGYHDPVVMLGSCFTENTGAKLERYLFDVTINPFGVVYNPLSIKNSIYALLHKEKYAPADLQQQNELWFSFDHYTKFSDPDPDAALDKINRAFIPAKIKLATAGHLLITFGTAYVYALKETGRVVSNCHKIPAAQFSRRILPVEEIVQQTGEMVEALLAVQPGMKIILTVSPVRHIKDGFTENQRSKASLLLAAGQLVTLFPETCSYFPSYEIMMDDLRDYRYYANDMLHPNEQATEYIWSLFRDSNISDEAAGVIEQLEPLLNAMNHRPLHRNTKAWSAFENAIREKRRKLKNDFPFLQWNKIK